MYIFMYMYLYTCYTRGKNNANATVQNTCLLFARKSLTTDDGGCPSCQKHAADTDERTVSSNQKCSSKCLDLKVENEVQITTAGGSLISKASSRPSPVCWWLLISLTRLTRCLDLSPSLCPSLRPSLCPCYVCYLLRNTKYVYLLFFLLSWIEMPVCHCGSSDFCLVSSSFSVCCEILVFPSVSVPVWPVFSVGLRISLIQGTELWLPYHERLLYSTVGFFFIIPLQLRWSNQVNCITKCYWSRISISKAVLRLHEMSVIFSYCDICFFGLHMWMTG